MKTENRLRAFKTIKANFFLVKQKVKSNKTHYKLAPYINLLFNIMKQNSKFCRKT